jgi:hypothetical protein
MRDDVSKTGISLIRREHLFMILMGAVVGMVQSDFEVSSVWWHNQDGAFWLGWKGGISWRWLCLLPLRERFGAMVLTIKRKGEEEGDKAKYLVPKSATTIAQGDVLVIFGLQKDLSRFPLSNCFSLESCPGTRCKLLGSCI